MYLLVAMTYFMKLKDIPNPKQLPVEERLYGKCISYNNGISKGQLYQYTSIQTTESNI